MKIKVLAVFVVIYVAFVVFPNFLERRNYDNCAADSITEAEAARFSYAGNVRRDTVSPKTCGDDSGISTFEERNILIPAVLQ